MEKIKVIHIIRELSGGGKERRMIQLLKGLGEDYAYEQVLICLDGAKLDYPEVYECNVQMHLLRDMDFKAKCRFVEGVIREVKPDIVHSWSRDVRLLPMYVKLRRALHFKLIDGSVSDGIVYRPTTKTYWNIKLSFLFSDLIVSNSMAGLVAKGAPMKKSRVIFNGFDYKRFANDVDVDALRIALGIPAGHKVVSMFARVSEFKDWMSFVNVAREAKAQRKMLSFLAVGKGDMLEYYQELVQKEGLDNIRFLGFRNDVEDLIRISYVTMLFSNDKVHAEGISNSIMESLAAGVPVVASKGGGTGEIIIHGKNGYIVEPGDSNGAYLHLAAMLEDEKLYVKLSKGALEDIHERFLLSTMVDNYRRIYTELLS